MGIYLFTYLRLGFVFAKQAFIKQMFYHFSHTPFCSGFVFEDGGLMNYLPKLASNCCLPDFSLSS
jgi:hypothetical protein